MIKLFKNLPEQIDRILNGGMKKQFLGLCLLILLGIITLIALSLLLPHDVEIFGLEGRLCRLKGLLYHFMDPGNIMQENDNQFWVQILVFITAFAGMFLLGGLLITTMTNIVDRRVSNVENGKVTYRNISGHYVIVGYGDVTISVVRMLFDRNAREVTHRRIIILTSRQVPEVRSELFSMLPREKEKYIHFYSGNIESTEHLVSLNFSDAEEVYVLGEESEYGRDSKNIECVKTIAALRGKGKKTLTVNVLFDKLTSYSIIQKLALSNDFLGSCGNGGSEATIYFRPFNFYENWARSLWGYTGSGEKLYEDLDFNGIAGNRYVHLVIVGFNRMGRALFLEALRLCHYPNFIEATESVQAQNKTRITIVDSHLDCQLPEFLSQYPYLEQIADIDIEYRNAMVEDNDIRSMLIKETENPDAMLTIAMCQRDPDLALSSGLCLPDDVFYRIKGSTAETTDTRILIRQTLIQEGIGQLLESNEAKYRNVHIFGMSDKGFCEELMNDDLAMYVNAYYATLYPDMNGPCAGILSEYKEYTCGWISRNKKYAEYTFIDWVCNTEHRTYMHGIAKRLWLHLSEDLRFSNRYQVDAYGLYTKYEGNPNLERMEHLRWNAERSIVGYRTSCDTKLKSLEYKLHPLIIPFCRLKQNDSAIKDDSRKECKKDSDVITNMKKLLTLASKEGKVDCKRTT